jgi:hypothetical protein
LFILELPWRVGWVGADLQRLGECGRTDAGYGQRKSGKNTVHLMILPVDGDSVRLRTRNYMHLKVSMPCAEIQSFFSKGASWHGRQL